MSAKRACRTPKGNDDFPIVVYPVFYGVDFSDPNNIKPFDLKQFSTQILYQEVAAFLNFCYSAKQLSIAHEGNIYCFIRSNAAEVILEACFLTRLALCVLTKVREQLIQIGIVFNNRKRDRFIQPRCFERNLYSLLITLIDFACKDCSMGGGRI